MANNINQVVDSLISINQVIENFRLQREKTELYDSNRFNPFQFMRTDEMGLSKILAFLLDPTETHGQGDLFLNSFLKFIGKRQFLAYEKINIYLEKTTKKITKRITKKTTDVNRRHDIFIEGLLNNKRAWVISIENKLQGAVDQKDQMDDYNEDLKNYTSDSYFLIYLPVFSDNPSKESISEEHWSELITNKKAMILSASMIMKWLDNTIIIAPAVKQFCNDFKKFLSEDVMGNTQDTNDLVTYLLDNESALDSALKVIDTTNTLYEKLGDILVEQLSEKFERYYPALKAFKFKCSKINHHSNSLFGIAIKREGVKFGIAIQFEKTWLQGCHYGFYCHKKDHPKLYKYLHDCFVAIRDNTGLKANQWWIGRRNFDKDYRNWDSEVLVKITTGELANYIFEHWKPLLEFFNSHLSEIKRIVN